MEIFIIDAITIVIVRMYTRATIVTIVHILYTYLGRVRNHPSTVWEGTANHLNHTPNTS